MFLYHVNLTPDDNDTFLVTSDDFPELVSFGETEEEAMQRAGDALEEAIGARIAAGEEIPPGLTPSTMEFRHIAKVSTLVAIKVLLYIAMRREGITRAELARRLDWHREQVDRLFRVDHSTQLDQFDQAFAALGRDVMTEIKQAA
jgi:antitoxin HicB